MTSQRARDFNAAIATIGRAAARVTEEIANRSNAKEMFSVDFEAEGYAGGYLHALQDVTLLLQNTCTPTTRTYWDSPSAAELPANLFGLLERQFPPRFLSNGKFSLLAMPADVYPGATANRVGPKTCRRICGEFMQQGKSSHGPTGYCLWVVLEFCRHNQIKVDVFTPGKAGKSFEVVKHTD